MKLDYEPVGTVSVAGKAVAGTVAAVVVVAAISWGGYEAGWWLKANAVNRNAAISRQSLGFQQARVDEINKKMEALASLKTQSQDPSYTPEQLAANRAQAKAVQTIVCADWRQLTPSYKQGLDTDLANTVSVMCQLDVNN